MTGTNGQQPPMVERTVPMDTPDEESVGAAITVESVGSGRMRVQYEGHPVVGLQVQGPLLAPLLDALDKGEEPLIHMSTILAVIPDSAARIIAHLRYHFGEIGQGDELDRLTREALDGLHERAREP